MPVPFGTCTARSSIVTVTRSVTGGACPGALTPVPCGTFVALLKSWSDQGSWLSGTRSRGDLGGRRMAVHRDRRQHVVQRGSAAEGAAALVDVRLELRAEL